MKSVIKQSPNVKKILEELASKTQAITVLLITKEGIIISEDGDSSSFNTTAIAALVAGMFSATREVARLVGEKQFSILLQQGEKRHIHISLVTDTTMMVIIFEDYRQIGRVRLEAKRASEELSQELSLPKETGPSGGDLSVPQFKEYALSLIDQIFTSER